MLADDVLALLRDGRRRSIDEIAVSLNASRAAVEALIDFLSEFRFVLVDNDGVLIDQGLLKFLR